MNYLYEVLDLARLHHCGVKLFITAPLGLQLST